MTVMKSCTSIKSIDVALTLARDLQLFLIKKEEEKAAEYQQKVISFLQDAKISCFVNARQTVIEEFFKNCT